MKNRIIEGISNGLFPTGLFKKMENGKLDTVKITASLISWGMLVAFATGLLNLQDLLSIIRFIYE